MLREWNAINKTNCLKDNVLIRKFYLLEINLMLLIKYWQKSSKIVVYFDTSVDFCF